ncbi:hypothetical protein GQ53DRAFT_840493 [Thozetella sp. PMI_491]|nr:hypothetical protein GQ53DRAFT_840493 [Thozetella sp. PMI_491]
MASGPVASQLCLLSELPLQEQGQKVRFLGCVVSYSSASGILTLRHPLSQGLSVDAVVDVTLVLQSLKSEHTRIGEWVNIIGYISAIAHPSPEAPPKQKRTNVHVQALLLWSTGPLDLSEYERSQSALRARGDQGDPGT